MQVLTVIWKLSFYLENMKNVYNHTARLSISNLAAPAEDKLLPLRFSYSADASLAIQVPHY